MVCIFCGNSTQVINSRPQKRSNTTWRRRQCTVCNKIATTEEGTLLGSVITVEALSGVRHPFEREKLLVSLYNSLRHRQTALADATALTDTVIQQLLKNPDTTLHATHVIQVVAAILERFDQAAAVQYRAFHPATFSSKKGTRA